MGRSRVLQIFSQVRQVASVSFPWISKAKLRRCALASREHRRRWRQFAHADHYRMTVCYAAEAEDQLTDRELGGLSAHELGHLVGVEAGFPAHKRARGKKGTPESVQKEANEISRRFFGLPIRYNRRTIQEIATMRKGKAVPR